jgi:signal transduction histidine kinase
MAQQFFVTNDRSFPDGPTNPNPLIFCIDGVTTSGTLTAKPEVTVPHSVQRTDGFMSDGRSGALDQTYVPQNVTNSEIDALGQAKREAQAALERHLCQIGADLHDGPAQLLALALLHLDTLQSDQSRIAITTASVVIRDAVAEALREVRDISVGLVLPELEHRSAAATVRLAVENYQRQTGCLVTVDDTGIAADFNPSKTIKICLYRLVQEGLQNGFKHAKGSAQSVEISLTRTHSDGEATLTSIVRDVRPDPCTLSNNNSLSNNASDDSDRQKKGQRADGTSTGIGLAGLKERIAALNGTFEINTTACGTELVARIAVTTDN